MVFNLINRVLLQWIPGVYSQENLPKTDLGSQR